MAVTSRRSKKHVAHHNGKPPDAAPLADVPAPKKGWWRDGFDLYNGVFEGGGAKGIAYVGALQAVRDHQRWFRRVAGSSVGSIIAALIATGLTVEQFEYAMKNVRTLFPPLDGLRSYTKLRKQSGIFDPAPLRDLLATILSEQVSVQSGSSRSDAAPVTFEELYQATGIELDVLAIDIFDRREVVFSHASTPECQVVDAILASSAIPGFFPPGRLCIRRSETVTLTHPIVDGGVWANFPLFVFRDDRFRTFHKLPTLTTPTDRQVMGFLLEESQLVTRGQRRARFADPLVTARFWKPEDRVLPAELSLLTNDATIMELADLSNKPGVKTGSVNKSVRRAVGSAWWYTPWQIAQRMQWGDESEDESSDGPRPLAKSTAELPWLSVIPGSRSTLARTLRFTSQILRSRTGFWLVLVAALLLGIGTVAATGSLIRAFHDVPIWAWALYMPALIFIVPIAVVVALGLLALLIGNVMFARAGERYGFLIFSTLASAGAVRYWMDGDEVANPDTGRPLTTILRVPVPEDMSTLSFQYVNVDFAIRFAKASVTDQLDAIEARATSGTRGTNLELQETSNLE